MGQDVDGNAVTGLDAHVAGACEHASTPRQGGDVANEVRLRLELALLEQKRQRLQSLPDGHAYDLLGLRDEHAGVCLEPAAELALREPRVDVKPRVAGRVKHDDSHGCLQTPGRPGKAN